MLHSPGKKFTHSALFAGELHTGKEWNNRNTITRRCARCRLFTTVTSLINRHGRKGKKDIKRKKLTPTLRYKRSLEHDFQQLFARLGNVGAMNYLATELNSKHFMQLQHYFKRKGFELDFQWCK